jgi:hypothetical protein
MPVALMLAYIDSWNILRTKLNVTHAFDEPQSICKEGGKKIKYKRDKKKEIGKT